MTWGAPGICSGTPASAPTPICTRWAFASARGQSASPSPMASRSSTTSRAPRPCTASTSTSGSTTRLSAPTGRALTTAGPYTSTPAAPKKRSPAHFCSSAVATTTTSRATRRSSRAPRTSPARSSTRNTGQKISTTRIRMSSLSAAVPHRSLWFRPWPIRGPNTSRCCSGPRPTSSPSPTRTRSPPRSTAGCPRARPTR